MRKVLGEDILTKVSILDAQNLELLSKFDISQIFNEKNHKFPELVFDSNYLSLFNVKNKRLTLYEMNLLQVGKAKDEEIVINEIKFQINF